MDKKFLAHIGIETAVIVGISTYFHLQNKKLKSRIEDCELDMQKMNDRIKILENSIVNLDRKMNNDYKKVDNASNKVDIVSNKVETKILNSNINNMSDKKNIDKDLSYELELLENDV